MITVKVKNVAITSTINQGGMADIMRYHTYSLGEVESIYPFNIRYEQSKTGADERRTQTKH